MRYLDQYGCELPYDFTATPVDEGLRSAFESMGLDCTRANFAVSDNPSAGLTCEEVAERLGLEPRTIRDICQRDDLFGLRYPSRWRISEDELESLKAKRGGDL